MKIDLNDLVSVTDLGRDLSAYIGRAQAGQRFVILNRNVPTAALVSIADLDRIEQAGATERPAQEWDAEVGEVAPVAPGFTRLGVTPGFGAADIPLVSTLSVSGKTGRGTSVALSAVIANANPDPEAPPVKFMVVSGGQNDTVEMYHAAAHELQVSVLPKVSLTGSFKATFFEFVSERLSELRQSKCKTIGQYRAEHPDKPIADIVFAAIDFEASALEGFLVELQALVSPSTLGEVGLYLWVFTQSPPRWRVGPLSEGDTRCKVVLAGGGSGGLTHAEWRNTFGFVPSRLTDQRGMRPGQGYVEVARSGWVRGVEKIVVQPPDAIDEWPLESTTTSPCAVGES
jgi:prevent-host-death family protein